MVIANIVPYQQTIEIPGFPAASSKLRPEQNAGFV
jgi:hypothetical protein